MLSDTEIRLLKTECLKLAKTSIQEDEAYVTGDPILILMSTVLSLNRKWYSHALPARRYFEVKVYPLLTAKNLEGLRTFIFRAGSDREDWVSVALALWNMREWDKARMLSELAEYFEEWRHANALQRSELECLRKWASSIAREQFVGRIKGLGPRAYEQILSYVEGKQAIKFDRHIANFTTQAVGRLVADLETQFALRQIAGELGISATALDARIWDHMQAHCHS